MHPIPRTLTLLLAAALPTWAVAQSSTVDVDAKSNIFGYGLTAPDPGGGGGGLVAPVVALNAGTGRTITFSASGTAGWDTQLLNGPDGGGFSANTNIPSVGPISAYSGPLSGFLVGVFIEAGNISALSAPGAISYADLSSYGLASYTPALRQVFFIGDGLTGTGSGATQVFHIPDAAGTLVLGIADAAGFNAQAGFYNDNVGSYSVSFQVAAVPEPATAALFGLGTLGLLAAARRRKA